MSPTPPFASPNVPPGQASHVWPSRQPPKPAWFQNLSLLAGGALDEVNSPERPGEEAMGRSWMRVGDTPAWGIWRMPPRAQPTSRSLLNRALLARLSCLTNTWPPLTCTARPRRCSSGMHTLKKRPGHRRATWRDGPSAWGGGVPRRDLDDRGQGRVGLGRHLFQRAGGGPGTYVVWAQALVDGAWQSVEKCLVAVRGR